MENLETKTNTENNVSTLERVKKAEKIAKVKKQIEAKTDKVNFDFSIFQKKGGKNTVYNYSLIVTNLQKKEIANFFIQAGILSDNQIKNILSHKSSFIESKTKFGEFKTEKKAIRNFKQNLEAAIENCKDKILVTKLQSNLKFYLSIIA